MYRKTTIKIGTLFIAIVGVLSASSMQAASNSAENVEKSVLDEVKKIYGDPLPEGQKPNAIVFLGDDGKQKRNIIEKARIAYSALYAINIPSEVTTDPGAYSLYKELLIKYYAIKAVFIVLPIKCHYTKDYQYIQKYVNGLFKIPKDTNDLKDKKIFIIENTYYNLLQTTFEYNTLSSYIPIISTTQINKEYLQRLKSIIPKDEINLLLDENSITFNGNPFELIKKELFLHPQYPERDDGTNEDLQANIPQKDISSKISSAVDNIFQDKDIENKSGTEIYESKLARLRTLRNKYPNEDYKDIFKKGFNKLDNLYQEEYLKKIQEEQEQKEEEEEVTKGKIPKSPPIKLTGDNLGSYAIDQMNSSKASSLQVSHNNNEQHNNIINKLSISHTNTLSNGNNIGQQNLSNNSSIGNNASYINVNRNNNPSSVLTTSNNDQSNNLMYYMGGGICLAAIAGIYYLWPPSTTSSASLTSASTPVPAQKSTSTPATPTTSSKKPTTSGESVATPGQKSITTSVPVSSEQRTVTPKKTTKTLQPAQDQQDKEDNVKLIVFFIWIILGILCFGLWVTRKDGKP